MHDGIVGTFKLNDKKIGFYHKAWFAHPNAPAGFERMMAYLDQELLKPRLHRWRFNLRMSNTEPLVRLNVESRGDAELMRSRTEEVLGILGGDP